MRPLSYLAVAHLLLATPAIAQSTSPTTSGSGRVGTPQPAGKLANEWALRYAKRITPTELRQDLTVLASDAYEGRATGQPGQQLAAAYLARSFAQAGLAGPVPHSDNPYYQHLTLSRTGVDPTSSVTVGGQTFRLGQDFYVLLRNPAAAAGGLQPTFVGYGISTAGYADYTPADPALRGKDLVMLMGEPRMTTGQPLLEAPKFGPILKLGSCCDRKEEDGLEVGGHLSPSYRRSPFLFYGHFG